MAKTATFSLSLMPALTRFFAWWGGELAALAPEKLRLWWKESDRIVMLSFAGKRAVFERQAGGRREEIHAVEAGASDPSALHAEISRRLLQTVGRNYLLLLCLPPEQVLQRTLALPLAIEENLRQALSFELDRYTPFRQEQAYFDFRVIERDAGQKRLSVELAAVPKHAVDEGVARAAALGLSVDGAVLAEEALRLGNDCRNFLPAASKRRKSSVHLWWRAGMTAFSAALLAVFLAVPIWQKRNAAIAMQDPLAQARVAAQETDALRDRLRKLVDEHNFLHDKKWDAPSTLLVLEELSKLLPDDTFVMQLDYDGKTVQIQGDTGSSTALVETLEASPLFKDVGFKSQLIKLQGTPFDRFHIGANLEAGAKPKPQGAAPDAAVAPAPVAPPSPAAAAAAPATPPAAAPPAPAAPKNANTAAAPSAATPPQLPPRESAKLLVKP